MKYVWKKMNIYTILLFSKEKSWNALGFPVFWIVQLFTQTLILKKSFPNVFIENENLKKIALV